MSPSKFVLPPDDIIARLGPPVTETVFVEEQSFLIRRPGDSDKRIDDKNPSGYTPYWAELWPGARMLARFIARETWPNGGEALELGCGLGLAGIVGLSRGLVVTFSDFDECALRFAADNARLNGFRDFRTRLLDWRHPPADCQFATIFGADLIYEAAHAELLANVIRRMLAPGGVCWLTDLERIPARLLHDALAQARLSFERQTVRAGEPGGRRWKGTLYRIRQW
jgi:predicted nicotinamide N-methyase